MGCSCCCPKKQISTKPLRIGSALYEAQRMRVTPSGHEINQNIRNKMLTKEEIIKLVKSPKTADDFRIVLNPPLNEASKITKYLYLTSIGGLTRENVDELGITLVINATYEWPNYSIEGIQFIRVPVEDGLEDDLYPYFDEVSDKIAEVAENNGKVLVHCMAGASRSTTLVLAYLIKYESISLHKAFKSVQKRRDCARPNTAFWQQLIKYEIRTRGKASVKMIQKNIQDVNVTIPDFYEKEFPKLFKKEIEKQINSKRPQSDSLLQVHKSRFEETMNMNTNIN